MDFLQELTQDKINYAHVCSALEHPYKIVDCPSNEGVIIHCTVSNVHIAEYKGTDYSSFCKILKSLPVTRLQTTNKKLQQLLLSDFKHHYDCVQAIFPENADLSSHSAVAEKSLSPSPLCLLHKEDLPYVQKTYEMDEYISQLYEHNRLFGWYENNTLIGYVAFHIDETVGALFVKPEFRKQGYGIKIMTQAFLNYKPGIRFAQIVDHNLSSIAMHKKMGCIIADKKISWLYNQEYNYNN